MFGGALSVAPPRRTSLDYAIGLSLVWVAAIVIVAVPIVVWLCRRVTG